MNSVGFRRRRKAGGVPSRHPIPSQVAKRERSSRLYLIVPINKLNWLIEERLRLKMLESKGTAADGSISSNIWERNAADGSI